MADALTGFALYSALSEQVYRRVWRSGPFVPERVRVFRAWLLAEVGSG